MSRLAQRAEIIKLGQALDLAATQLDFLSIIPAEDLRRLRAALDERLFSQEQQLLRRAAAIARWLPLWSHVFLSRFVLGPVLTASLAGELPAHRAAAVVMRLPPDFIAEAVRYLDPRRVRDVIQLLPVERIMPIAEELLRRADYLTMGRVIEFLPDDVIRALEPLIQDVSALPQIAFFMESRNRLDHILRLLPEEKVRAAILLVRDETRRELWPMILALVANVSYALKRELGELAAQQGAAVLNALVNAIQEEDTWADVLPVVVCLSPETQRRLANLPILNTPGVLDNIIRTAVQEDLWGAALSLLGLMNEDLRKVAAQIADRLPRAAGERAVYAALLGEHFETLLSLVGRMSAAKQQEFADIVQGYGAVDEELLDHLARRARHYGFGERFHGAAAETTPVLA